MFLGDNGFRGLSLKKIFTGFLVIPSFLGFNTVVFASQTCYEEKDAQREIDFSNSGDYTFDTNQIDISGGKTSLKVKTGTFTKQSIAGDLFTDSSSSTGAFWADYDNDGDQDVFVTTGSNEYNELYQNNGNGTFTKITSGIIVSEHTSSKYADWGDYNGDGNIDLIVSDFPGPPLLYRNNGGGSFTKITTTALTSSVSLSGAVKWGDFDNDGDLDLYVRGVTNQIFFNNGTGIFTLPVLQIDDLSLAVNVAFIGGVSVVDYNNDGNLDIFTTAGNGLLGSTNRLYENDGTGSFDFVSGAGSIVTDSKASVDSVWFDYDKDGDKDVYVTNWGQANSLYTNNGNETFTELVHPTVLGGSEKSWGVDTGDYDKDGYPDLFVANWDGVSDVLYNNNKNGTFSANEQGTFGNDSVNSTMPTFVDYNNDGYLDIFVAVDGGANLLYKNNAGNMYPEPLEITAISKNVPITLEDLIRMVSITPTYGAGNQGSIELQISMDGGASYLYWNGSSWTTVTSNIDRNTITDLNQNISSLPVSGDNINLKIYLVSNGLQQVEVEKITFNFKQNKEVICSETPTDPKEEERVSGSGKSTFSGGTVEGFSADNSGGDARFARVRTYLNFNGFESFAGYIPGKLDLTTHPKHEIKRRLFLRNLTPEMIRNTSLEERQNIVEESIQSSVKEGEEVSREYTVIKESFNETQRFQEDKYKITREVVFKGGKKSYIRETLQNTKNTTADSGKVTFSSAGRYNGRNKKRGGNSSSSSTKYSTAETSYLSREKRLDIEEEQKRWKRKRNLISKNVLRTKINSDKSSIVRFRFGGKSTSMKNFMKY